MFKSSDVNFIAQEPILDNSSPICDLETQNGEDFKKVLSPIKRKNVSQEHKDITMTPTNKRKCAGKTESPPKRCKRGVQSYPSVVQPAVEKSYGIISPNSIPIHDVHPGGGLWDSRVSERLKNTVVIFDWDDTIFPSSYLALLEIDYDTVVVPQCLKDRIYLLETHVLELLEFVISMVGERRVCVITNAEKGWITLSGQKFMPRLLKRVYDCRIMSARSTFEPFSQTSGPFEWKLLAFHMAAEVSFGSRFPKPSVYAMKPRQVVVQEQRQEGEESFGADENEYFDEDSDSNEDVDRIPVAFLEHHSPTDSEGTTDTEDNCIVQFSADCLNQGGEEVTRGLTLSSSAAGNLHNGDYQATSVGHDFLQAQKKIEMIYMPCNEIVTFPTVPEEYLKHNGFDFVPAEDMDNALYSRKYIVSLGDSLAEKIATQNIASAIPNTITKTVKYMDRPNLDQLVTQTILVRSHIQEYLEMLQALDVVINIPDHDMSAFEREFRNQKT